MMNDHLNIAAVILAGGAGRRMAGNDKGLLAHNGQRLVESVAHTLAPQVDRLCISANRNLAEYQSLGYPVISDHDPTNLQGPLAGVVAAIDYLQDSHSVQFLLVCPCDTPKLPLDLVSRLAAPLASNAPEDAPYCGAVVHDGTRQQSLHYLIARPLWASLLEYVHNGGRAAYRWHKKTGSIEVDFSDQADHFFNINRLTELAC